MDELSNQARRLIEEGMQGDRPAAGARGRVWEALQAQIGAPIPDGGDDPGTPAGAEPSPGVPASPPAAAPIAPVAAPTTTATAAGTSATHLMLGAAVVIAAATVGTTLILTEPDPESPVVRTPSVTQPLAPEELGSAGPPVQFRLRPPPTRGAPTRSVDALAQEAKLLQEAQRALKAGDPRGAMGVLDAHTARFPDGALRPEREVARVLCLCDLGDIAAASIAGRALLAEQPTGPLADRVRSSCADLPNSISSD